MPTPRSTTSHARAVAVCGAHPEDDTRLLHACAAMLGPSQTVRDMRAGRRPLHRLPLRAVPMALRLGRPWRLIAAYLDAFAAWAEGQATDAEPTPPATDSSLAETHANWLLEVCQVQIPDVETAPIALLVEAERACGEQIQTTAQYRRALQAALRRRLPATTPRRVA